MTACLEKVGGFSLPQLYINVVWWRFGESLCGHGFDSHHFHPIITRDWKLQSSASRAAKRTPKRMLPNKSKVTWAARQRSESVSAYWRAVSRCGQPRQPTRQLSLLVNHSRISAPTTAHFLGGDWIWRQRSRWSRGLQADNRQSKNRFSGPQRHACRSLSVGTTKVQPFTEKSLEGFIFVKFINYRQETLKNLGQKLNLWRKLKIIDKKFCRLLKKSYLCTRK